MVREHLLQRKSHLSMDGFEGYKISMPPIFSDKNTLQYKTHLKDDFSSLFGWKFVPKNKTLIHGFLQMKTLIHSLLSLQRDLQISLQI